MRTDSRRLIGKLGIDKVESIINKAPPAAQYYADKWTDSFGGVHGYYADECLLGYHNRNTHYKLSELKAAVNAIRKQSNC